MSNVLSIITIAYNDLSGIQYTCNSIGSYLPEIEHIIIDGGSNDGTKEYLESQPFPIQWISERDNGLYDAMNKGLEKATGDYVLFMNSNDGFYESNTLKNITELLVNNQPDILYGETMLRDEDNQELGIRSEKTTRKLPDNLTWKGCINGMVVCHQSLIVKREISPKYIENNLSADFDWMIKCLKNAEHVQNANMIITNYLIGGVSQQQQLTSLLNRWKVFTNHFGLFKTLIAHAYFVLRFVKFKWFRP